MLKIMNVKQIHSLYNTITKSVTMQQTTTSELQAPDLEPVHAKSFVLHIFPIV